MNQEEKNKIRIKFAFNYLFIVLGMTVVMALGYNLTIRPSNALFMVYGFFVGLLLLEWTLDLISKYSAKYPRYDDNR